MNMSRTLLIFTCFLLTFATQAKAVYRPLPPEQRHSATITLEEMGYTTPLIVRGKNPLLEFVIPYYSGVDNKNTTAHFRFLFSKFLNQNSSISIFVNDIPLLEKKVSDLGVNPQIDLPLNNASQALLPPYHVQILGNLITDDQNPNNAWFILENSSTIDVTLDPAHFPLFNNLPIGVREIPIILTCQDLPCLEAAIRMASGIGAYYHPWKLTTQILAPSPHSPSQPSILIGDYKTDIEQKGGNLYLTPKGVNIILSKYFTSLTSLQNLSSIQLEDVQNNALPINQVNFESLGFTSHTLTGIGDLSLAIPFRLSDFNTLPSSLKLNLVLSHSDLKSTSSAYLSIQLNGALIGTQEINKDDLGLYSFSLPIYLLQEQNMLEITAAYFPTSDEIGANSSFGISILSHSTLDATGGRKIALNSISSFAGRFIGSGLFILSKPDLAYCQVAAHYAELMGRVQKRPLLIHATTFADRDGQNYDYALAFVPPDELRTFNPILDLGQNFTLVNPLTHEVFAKGQINEPIGVMQLLNTLSYPLLAVSDQQIPPYRWAGQLNEDIIQQLEGNVAIYLQGYWHPLEVGSRMIPFYGNQFHIPVIWAKIKGYVVGILSLIALWFVWYVRKNLTRGGPVHAE